MTGTHSFSARLSPPDERGCVNWLGKRNWKGYGRLRDRAKVSGETMAHRVAWERANGPVPDNLCVCHVCDNRLCCTPAHLFLGTKADNNHDMHAKARGARGERVPQHVLSESDVRAIRARYAAGGVTQAQLGQEYGVQRGAISKVVNRVHWGWLSA